MSITGGNTGGGNYNPASVAITGGSIVGITDLAIADGGTGASTAANARTNLGLGTIATQAASAVALTGGTVAGVTISASPMVGVVGNTAAAAGNVGEVIAANVAAGSAVSLTSTTVADVTSISLTAGDWDISGVVGFLPAAATSITALSGGESATSATMGALGTFFGFSQTAVVLGAVGQVYTIPTTSVRLAITTTIYLVAKATFSISTLGAYGLISARRSGNSQ